MKTFETMKHNIPEGATHYQEEGDEYLFAWFSKTDDSLRIFVPESPFPSWNKCSAYHYEDLIKPIPTETPEEKEALDTIEKTYRFEKVMDSIFGLKEEFERGELFSFDGNEHYVQIETEGDFSYAHIYENLYRRIEITERELFIDAATEMYNKTKCDDFPEFIQELFDSGKFKFVNGKG